MLEFRNPLPVVTLLGEGYAIYVTSAGSLDNDIFCVVLDDGRLLHFATNQLQYVGNATLGLKKPIEHDPLLQSVCSHGPRFEYHPEDCTTECSRCHKRLTGKEFAERYP